MYTLVGVTYNDQLLKPMSWVTSPSISRRLSSGPPTLQRYAKWTPCSVVQARANGCGYLIQRTTFHIWSLFPLDKVALTSWRDLEIPPPGERRKRGKHYWYLMEG